MVVHLVCFKHGNDPEEQSLISSEDEYVALIDVGSRVGLPDGLFAGLVLGLLLGINVGINTFGCDVGLYVGC